MVSARLTDRSSRLVVEHKSNANSPPRFLILNFTLTLARIVNIRLAYISRAA